MKIIERDNKLFPEKLKEIKPIINQIYVEGKIENLKKLGVAVIGSRNSSIIGEKTTCQFVKKLVQNDINIISGLAMRN